MIRWFIITTGETMKFIYKILFMILGTISVVLGVIGIFLPILPTTPFLLLAVFFYLKSSEKMYCYLINNKYLGSYIKNYTEKKGISLKTKIFVLTLLWISITFSALFVIDQLLIRILLFLIAFFVSWHILSQKTITNK